MLQNTLLGSLVVFASLLVLCNTQCYVELYDKNPEDPPDGESPFSSVDYVTAAWEM